MRIIRVARGALLVTMFLRGIHIGAVQQLLIGPRLIGDDAIYKFVLAHHGKSPPALGADGICDGLVVATITPVFRSGVFQRLQRGENIVFGHFNHFCIGGGFDAFAFRRGCT